MNVTWHRAAGTVENYSGNYTARPYYYEIPVLREDLSRYLDYYTNDDLAISLVFASRHDESHYSELLAKRSFWMIKNLCERTDVKDEGVAIQLSVDDTLKDIVIPYAEACRFPLDRINYFTSKERGFGCDNFCKIEALLDAVFRDKERVLHMDLSVHFGEHPTQAPRLLFQRIKMLWRDEPIALMEELLQVNTPDMKANPMPVKRKFWDRRKESKGEWAAYIGHSPDDEERYWRESEWIYRINGKVFGLHRNLMDSPLFADEILKLGQMGGDDETVLLCYVRKRRWTESDIANIEKCFGWSDSTDSHPHYKECSVVPAYSVDNPSIYPTNFERFWLSQHINNEHYMASG